MLAVAEGLLIVAGLLLLQALVIVVGAYAVLMAIKRLPLVGRRGRPPTTAPDAGGVRSQLSTQRPGGE